MIDNIAKDLYDRFEDIAVYKMSIEKTDPRFKHSLKKDAIYGNICMWHIGESDYLHIDGPFVVVKFRLRKTDDSSIELYLDHIEVSPDLFGKGILKEIFNSIERYIEETHNIRTVIFTSVCRSSVSELLVDNGYRFLRRATSFVLMSSMDMVPVDLVKEY